MIETRMRTSLLIGGVLAAVYVVVALACVWHTSSVEFIRTAAPIKTRAFNLTPPSVLAAGLLVVGLVARRWWQAPLAPVALVGLTWWSIDWFLDLPRRVQENNWTIDHAGEVADRVATVTHVLAVALVVVGWSLVRRSGWWWAVGLLPAAMVVATGQAARGWFEPGPLEGNSAQSVIEQVSHGQREYGVAGLVIDVAVVVACVWLCAVAERHLPLVATQPVPTLPPPTADTPPPVPASPYVADELRKLAELRDGGVLDDEEFQRQKGRLLEQ